MGPPAASIVERVARRRSPTQGRRKWTPESSRWTLVRKRRTPVRRPGDIVSLLSGVTFANVEDVVAVNLTLGEMAGPDDVLLLPDGSFSGFVPVSPGKNRIRISALASDGSRGSTELEFEFKHQELTDAELEAELERVRRRNRELQMLMERKRQEEFRKIERERMLEIEVEDEGDQP